MIGFAAIAVASALWRPIGPYDTSGISAMAVNPRDRRTTYIATGYPNGFTTGTAVYRSDDGGISWTEHDLGLPRARDHDVRSLAVDPSGTVYAAMTLEGVYRSNDEGVSWTLALPDKRAWAVAVDAVTGRVYASSAGDVYRLDEDTWTRLGSIGSATIRFLINDPLDGRTLYAIGDDRVLYRSSDRGVSWKSVYSALQVTAIGIDDRENVVIGTADFHVIAPPLLARSSDRGETWSVVGGDLPSQVGTFNPPQAIAFDGADIYVATTNTILRSRDGGNSWARLAFGSEIGSLVKGEPGVMLAGTSSIENSAGVLRKTSDDVWQFSNLGIHNVDVDNLVASGPFIYAETDRAGADFFVQRFDGRAWQSTWSPRTGFVTPIRSAGDRLYGETSSGILQLSYDHGITWTPLATSGIDCGGIGLLLVDPLHPQTLYGRAISGGPNGRTICAGFFRSNDGGTTWVHADAGLPVATGTDIRLVGPVTISSNGTLVIVTGRTDGAFAFNRSNDGGVTWTSIAKLAASYVDDLAADVSDEKLLYVLTDAGVYVSANGGDSWQLALALPGTTTGNLLPASARGHLFATDGKAVYETRDAGANWKRISDALPPAPIRKLALDHDGHLFVGTDGSGVFLELPARSRAVRK